MISSGSFSVRTPVLLFFCLACISVTGAPLPAAASQDTLQVHSLTADRPSPQVSDMTTIQWTARASGGTGALTYEFRTLRDSVEFLEQSGPSARWDWTPRRAGIYRIGVTVRDSTGNSAQSDWSPDYVIEPELRSADPVADRPSPQALPTTSVWWTVKATGGAGDLTYEFHILGDAQDRIVQTGPSPEWNWEPGEAGTYRVKAVVRDSLGNKADSGWSGDYRIDTFVNLYSPVAVMPVSNISKQQAPYAEMRSLLKFLLIRQGLDVISDEVLERFLEKHRIRYTGGLNRTDAQALEAENVARAVLITSLEHYDKMYPPRIALTARLVSTGESPEILWVDSIAMAGHDTPKLLNLGMISSHRVLLQKAVKSLADSFDRFLQGKQDFVTVKRGWLQEPRFEPKIYYHAGEIIDMNRGYTVAVLPFFNLSERAYAGDLIQLHFAREMGEFKNFNIIEPGIVRDVLLKIRAIMYDGISLEQAQVIFSILQADFILTGTVLDYNDYSGEIGKPTVDFSALLIERQDRQTLWTSKSYNKGDDDVFFFDLGKINTANTMAAEMVRIIVEMMVRGE